MTDSSVYLAPTTPGSCFTNWRSKPTGGAPATSPADWSGRLTNGQRLDLLAIPPGSADRESVAAAHLAGREVFTRRGRETLGEAWPTDMEMAVTAHVDRVIAASEA